MSNLNRSATDYYNESEAAAAIGISVARLHQLLDEHIFTDGHQRPESLEFTSSDLLLLSYWNNHTRRAPTHEVIAMPKRK
jgi:hypothetical protein